MDGRVPAYALNEGRVRRLLRAGSTLLTVATLLLTLGPPAAADPPAPGTGETWFGPTLAAEGDGLEAYAERLGAVPSLVAVEVPFPLDEPGRELVERFARDAARAGAVLLLDARPTVPLSSLDSQDARELATTLATLEARPGTSFLVRFAPEMNGSWETWGQQPDDYVRAFRQLATALHTRTDAGTVWAPVYGAGYPFRASDGALDGAGDDAGLADRDRAILDTDGDGRLGPGDDPYAPYYPGDQAVDWVGLSLYRLGQSQALRRNVQLPEAELASRLAETWGYGDDADRTPFVDRFATTARPMLVETAAPYNPAVGGDPELSVKRGWWQQALVAATADDRIGGISWLEVARREPEVADVVVDWRLTADPRIARALLRDLERLDVALAPVVPTAAERARDRLPSAGRPSPGAEPSLPEQHPVPEWLWWLATGLLALAFVLGVLLPRWRYGPDDDGDEGRDQRLDLVRGGLLLATVVVAVLAVGLDVLAVSAWVPVAAAGTLLVVSGIAHGLADVRLTDLGGAPAAFSAHLRRALVVYLAAVLLSLVHVLLDAAPGVASPFGSYDDAERLLDYPPPGPVVLLGLFALLAAAAAPLAALVRRGWWWLALGLSWAAFALGTWSGATIPGAGWEAGWPILVWQLPFVHGLVVGDVLAVHGERIARRRTLLLVVATLLAATWAVTVALGLVPSVPVMAVVAVSAVVLLCLATAVWGAAARPLGWVVAAGRRPLLLSLLLVVAVVGAARV